MLNVDSLLQSKLASGLVGSLIGMAISKECKTWGSRCVYVLCGVGISYYFSVPLVKHFGVTDPDTANMIGCGVGICWQPLIARFAAAFENISLPWMGGSK